MRRQAAAVRCQAALRRQAALHCASALYYKPARALRAGTLRSVCSAVRYEAVEQRMDAGLACAHPRFNRE